MAETQPAPGTHEHGAHEHGAHTHGAHGKEHPAGHHGDALPQYLLVFLALMLLTAVTVWVSYIQFPTWDAGHLTIAMIVSVIKATLVVLIFMHVWHSAPLIKVIICVSLFTLALLLGFTYADYWSRPVSGVGLESKDVRLDRPHH
jgi:cytochrome c oxidase subunit 4